VIRKGIILAGGKGTRMSPLTKAVNKQLLPIYDKPLIFYPLSILMLANIRDILIIVKPSDKLPFNKLLGDGRDFGIKIEYVVQNSPRGLPDAFILGKKFIKKDSVALILGDNFFHGQSLIELLNKASKNFNTGANIFSYNVNNPQDYGVVENLKNKIRIVEKPNKTKSRKAITGLYFFDNDVVKLSNKLKYSKRGELEIVDLLNFYLDLNKLAISELGRGSAWLDTGTSKDILKASNYVEVLQDRQNQKIGCLEEIAFKKKWINKSKLRTRIKFYGSSEYSDYLNYLLNESA